MQAHQDKMPFQDLIFEISIRATGCIGGMLENKLKKIHEVHINIFHNGLIS
jgi:hypothetical protein